MSDTLSPLHQKVEATRAVLADSISIALENTTKLQDIEAQSESLAETTNVFRSKAGELRRQLFWKNVKMKVAIGLGVVSVLGVIAGIGYAILK